MGATWIFSYAINCDTWEPLLGSNFATLENSVYFLGFTSIFLDIMKVIWIYTYGRHIDDWEPLSHILFILFVVGSHFQLRGI